MDTLPLEILEYIFVLACANDSHTGNALSLTSKSIRAASRTVRFRTISLTANPRRLTAFLTLYERECEHAGEACKPRVRHLYAMFPRIGDLGQPQRPRPQHHSLSPSPRRRHREEAFKDCGRHRPSSGSPDSILEHASLRDLGGQGDPGDTRNQVVKPSAEIVDLRGRQLFDDSTISPAYFATARRLFRLVARDLWTLILQSGFRESAGSLWLELFTAPFPALKSLTLFEVAAPTGLFPKIDNDVRVQTQCQRPLFPSLTHLHLLPTPKGYYYQLKTWASHAPRVTHLRISGARASLIVVDQLARATGVVPPSVTSGRRAQRPLRDLWEIMTFKQLIPGIPPPLPPMPLFCELRSLLIQPGPAPDDNEMDRRSHHDGVQELLEFAEACRATGLQVDVLPSSERKGPGRMYLEQVREDWFNAISGEGAGIWACE